ncbi:MAG: flagellar M-ring protein FliF [Proteobacteria bacterium]|nr:flagellar M-ring protein FliF [Pseudomonadota bacterium]
MANIATINSTFTQINALSQLHIVRQLVFMLIVAAGIALGTAIVMWSTNSDYTVLYVDMASQDGADVIAVLEQSGTPYIIDSNTGTIAVPADIVQIVRLQLANEGLPRVSSRGYDILEDEQGIGTSNFIEQARFNRALEQELVQTISHIQGVRDARVHLSVPKQTSFIRNSNKPSASVMIDLINPRSLSETQLMGIVHLVASSVAGLEAENVTVVDQRGNLLSHRSDSEFGTSSENIRFTRGIEEIYSSRIIDILTPIVGVGNVRAQVSASLDFTLIETTEETYNPNAVVIRSEQTQQENSGANSTSAVEPGTLSQTPPLTNNDSTAEKLPSSNSNQTRTSSTRNYEIDRSVSLIRTVPGSIRQISVAVLVDLHAPKNSVDSTDIEASTDDAALAEAANLDQEKIDRLTQLVKNTVGFNEARGDIVSIINEQFYAVAELPPAAEIPVWQQPWLAVAAKQFAASLVVLFLIFGVLRPAMKSVVSSQGGLPGQNTALLAGASSTEIADDKVSLSKDANTLPAPVAPGKSVYDENLNLAQELVSNEPARAARMIQNWLAND